MIRRRYVLSIIAISIGLIGSFVAIREINNLGDGEVVLTTAVLSSNTTIIRSEDNNFNSSGKENENQRKRETSLQQSLPTLLYRPRTTISLQTFEYKTTICQME